MKAIKIKTEDCDNYECFERPLLGYSLTAGFPSPAEDFIEERLDLNKYLIQHKEATFFVRVDGDSMIGAGIFNKDILIVDRALEPQNNSIVIAVIDNEMTVKRLIKGKNKWHLHPENSDYPMITLEKEMDFTIWGVVSYVIHKP